MATASTPGGSDAPQVDPEELDELRHTERVHRMWFERAPSGVALVGLDGTLLEANPALCAILGRPGDEVRGTRFQDLTHPDDLDADLQLAERVLRGEIDRYDLEKRYVRPDGTPVWVHLRVALTHGDDGRPEHFIAMVEDITERRRAEDQLRAAVAMAEAAIDRSPIPTLHTTLDGTITKANAAAIALLGADPGLAIGHRTVEFAHPDEVPAMEEVFAKLASGELATATRERRVQLPSGPPRVIVSTTTAVPGPEGEPEHLVIQLHDVTAERQETERLVHAAAHDALTGLANRARLREVLAEELARTGAGRATSVLFVDLQGFKAVNDRWGHDLGDRLLTEVAREMRAAVRAEDLVARYGGDEFVVVLPGVAEDGLDPLITRLEERIAELGPELGCVRATVGRATSDPEAPVDADALLAAADADMYRRRDRAASR